MCNSKKETFDAWSCNEKSCFGKHCEGWIYKRRKKQGQTERIDYELSETVM